MAASIRDRLRAFKCPADIIDAIIGWATEAIGHRYGRGYEPEVLSGRIKK